LIAAEALQQSRQAWLSEVSELTSFARLVGGARTTETVIENGLDGLGVGDLGLPARADRGGMALQSSATRFVLIGPEGGWSDSERVQLPETVGIAPAVLRAETAAIVAGALLVQRNLR
jgi:16S rRNA (uracil1498-N3)-methyltransferase